MFAVWDAHANFCCIGKSMNIDFTTYIYSIISAAGKTPFSPCVVFLSLLYPLLLLWFRPWHTKCHRERSGWLDNKSPWILGGDLSNGFIFISPSICQSVTVLLFLQVSLWLRCPLTHPIPSAYLPAIHRSRPLLRARTPAWACVVRSDYRPLHCPRQVGPRHWPADRG